MDCNLLSRFLILLIWVFISLIVLFRLLMVRFIFWEVRSILETLFLILESDSDGGIPAGFFTAGVGLSSGFCAAVLSFPSVCFCGAIRSPAPAVSAGWTLGRTGSDLSSAYVAKDKKSTSRDANSNTGPMYTVP